MQGKIIIIGSLLLLAASGIYTESAVASSIESLIMPGQVIEGHAEFEHVCSKCHEKFDRKKQRIQCLACHKEVNRDIKIQKGYHGINKNIRVQECGGCHTEHKGRSADIVKLDKLTFNHQYTDFKLHGQHAKVGCDNCHERHKKYREAPNTCYSCHGNQNPHNTGKMGNSVKHCESCHTEISWRRIRYNHKQTKFPLTGQHARTSCVSCHIGDNYLRTPKSCIACHQADDIHANANGKNCQKCHSTQNWKKMSFDHNKDTDFPLNYRHIGLNCQSCHRDDPYKTKIKSTCFSCHSHDDQHKSNFGNECRTCHSDKGWSIIHFSHDKDTKFELKGKHRNTNCINCHKINPYKYQTKTDCYSCHRIDDVHKGAQGTDCRKCHNETGWRSNVRFEHDISRFPLIGLHAVVPCEECHLSGKYKGAPIECNSCHDSDDVHKSRLGRNCQICHTPNSWNIWRFDHDKQSRFKLDGAHKKLHCYSCHISPTATINSTPRPCINCHRRDDEHNGQFGPRCNRCHTTKSFKDLHMSR